MMETAAPASTTGPPKKDPLSVLASLATATDGPSKDKEVASPKSAKKKSQKASGKKTKNKKSSSDKKRKRDPGDEAKQETKSPRLFATGPPAHVFVNANPNNVAAAAAAEVNLATQQLKERHQLQQQLQLQQQAQQAQQQQQEQQRLLMNRIPESFLSRQYAAAAALEQQEELEMAALRRRREQLWMNMNMPPSNAAPAVSQAELMMMRAAAAANGAGPAPAAAAGPAAGLNMNNRALLMGNQMDLGAGMPMNPGINPSAAFAAQRMGFPPASLMGNAMGNPMGNPAATNSPLMRGFPGQPPMGGLPNPALGAAASNFPHAAAAAMGGNPALAAESALSKNAAASSEPAAKRLAPARGVFDKNLKSKDDVIDSLARANARFYKSEGKKVGQRFRGYQCEQWTQKYQELLEFQQENGNCQVPHCYEKNIGLARWTKRQRYQYKLMIDGKQSTMTDERVKLLEDVGFIWDSHAATWEERLNELREYRRIHGDCNVPSSYSENPKLATWIKCQRRQYKLLKEGRLSNMTLERMTELQRIGFCWRVQER